MNRITLKINELGPIRNSEITVTPLVILSGESGLGKSYTAFLIFYVYNLLLDSRIDSFVEKHILPLSKQAKEANQRSFSIPTKELFDWINKDAVEYLGYLIGQDSLKGDIKIEFPYSKDFLTFTITDELSGLEGHEELYRRITLDRYLYNVITHDDAPIFARPFSALLKATLRNSVFDSHSELKRAYLMPTSRGSLMELSERPVFRSGMYHEFFNLKADLAKPLTSAEPISSEVETCLNDVNLGRLKQEEDRIIYQMMDGTSIPLTAAASSIKELSPFTLFLNKFPLTGSSILLEEPEAHLHPARQEKLADLVSYFIGHGGYMQITTHSDYFIKRLNTLIKLYTASANIPENQTMAFNELLKKFGISKECLLNARNIGAYILERADNGHSRIRPLNVIENDEIPFESFYKVINDEFLLYDELSKMMGYGNS